MYIGHSSKRALGLYTGVLRWELEDNILTMFKSVLQPMKIITQNGYSQVH